MFGPTPLRTISSSTLLSYSHTESSLAVSSLSSPSLLTKDGADDLSSPLQSAATAAAELSDLAAVEGELEDGT